MNERQRSRRSGSCKSLYDRILIRWAMGESDIACSRRAEAIGVKYLPGMRYCMFIASSRILSPLKQIAAALNKIALTNDQPTPTQATTYDQSYEISELSLRT